MSIRRDFPDLPPVWAAATLALQWAAGAWAPILRFDGSDAGASRTDAAGGVLVVAGLGLAIWAAVSFMRHRTAIEPRETPTTLLVDGPFRINRNPIYAGGALVLIGAGLIFGALSSLLLAFAFPWIVTRRFIFEEEAALRAAFGAEAKAYFADTRRW